MLLIAIDPIERRCFKLVDINVFELISSVFTLLLSTGLGWLVWNSQQNKQRQFAAEDKADERDKQINKILVLNEEQTKIIEAHTKTLAHLTEIQAKNERVLDEHTDTIATLQETMDKVNDSLDTLEKHSEELETLNNNVATMSHVVKAVSEADRVQLAYMLERLGNQFLITGYIHSAQLKDFEAKFKIYSDGLKGNGAIEKLHKDVMKLPIRDDLPIINANIEQYKEIMKKVNAPKKTSNGRKRKASTKPEEEQNED